MPEPLRPDATLADDSTDRAAERTLPAEDGGVSPSPSEASSRRAEVSDQTLALPASPVSNDPNTTVAGDSESLTPSSDPGATLAVPGPDAGADQTCQLPPAGQDQTCQLPPSAADQTCHLSPPSAGAGKSAASPAAATKLSPPLAGGPSKPDVPTLRASLRAGSTEASSASTFGERFDQYEVVQELGRGAMGVVYKARHIALNRVVALKMVLAGAQASTLERARFLIEAEAVARLQHPNIVQIFEIGEHNGQPYFSLEFCEGGSLADRLASGALPGREAARIVEQLARAMDAAHRHGVVHRDLKPANVLLTAAGVPKVTDFGLAKRLNEDSKATRAGSIMGTPSYMAPEQAEGRTDEVGPLADVYALGAILYDLLTGRPPFMGKTVLETLTQVRKQDPVPPSRLNHQLPRDLETICLKCLAKDRPKRYAAAGDLAEDLRRFQAGEPITARPTPSWERAVMWCRRRPATAALLGVLALVAGSLLVGGVAYADHEHRRAVREASLRQTADEQRQRAEDNFHKAREAVDIMLTRVAEERLEYEPRMERVRRDLLEQALRFYNAFLEQKSDDPEVRWQTARALDRVGEIQRHLGASVRAEQAYRRGLELLETLAADQPAEPRFRHDQAAVLGNLANLLEVTGQREAAETAYRQAITLQQELADTAADRPRHRQDLAVSRRNLGIVLSNLGKRSEALEQLRQALELLRDLQAHQPRQPGITRELARSQGTLFRLLQGAGEMTGAEQALRESLRLFEELAARQPAAPSDRQELATAHDRLGDLVRLRDAKQAVKYYGQAITLAQALVADFPTVPDYKQLVASSYNNLAIALLSQGQRLQADQALRGSLAVKEELATLFPRRPDYRLDLARSQVTHGVQMQTAGRLADGSTAYRRAAELLTGLVREFPTSPEYRFEAGRALVNLGTLHQLAGRLPDAEKAYREALPLLSDAAALPERQAEQARGQYLLGTLLQMTGKLAEAEKLHRSALAALRQLTARADRDPDQLLTRCSSMVNLGDLLRTTGRVEECLQLWTEAEELLGRLAREVPSRYSYVQEQARTLHNLGVVYHGLKRDREAEQAHRKALALRRGLAEKMPGEAALKQEVASSLGELGVILGSTNRLDAAASSFADAITLLRDLQKSFPDQPVLANEELVHQGNLASLYEAKGDRDRAATCRKRMTELKKRLEKPGAP